MQLLSVTQQLQIVASVLPLYILMIKQIYINQTPSYKSNDNWSVQSNEAIKPIYIIGGEGEVSIENVNQSCYANIMV